MNHALQPTSVLESNASTSLEVVCSRVLEIRERLRVEEIVSELQPDMDRLYLDPPAYVTSQARLGDVRILIIQTCHSLAYIARESSSHGLNIDFSAIDSSRISQRPPDHPFHIISKYLKPEAWKEFHDYSGFLDLHRINGWIGADCWEELSADDAIEVGGSGSSTTVSSLDSDHSKVFGNPNPRVQVLATAKLSYPFNVHDDAGAYRLPHKELRQRISLERPGIVGMVY